MNGQKLIIATFATEYAPDRSDNTYYYRFTFLTTNQGGIFALSKFGPEKSFVKQIGESGIIINDSLSSQKVAEFIALKSKNPQVAPVQTELYGMVKRSRTAYMELKNDLTVNQDNVIIGSFKDVSRSYDLDTYEFSIPAGLVVATVTFTGGTKANQFRINRLKNGQITNGNHSR